MSPWRRTFVSAFVAQILSLVGFSFCFPFLPFFVGELGVAGKSEQAFWSGVAISAAGVTLALFAPLWGMLADRYGRKAMVVRAMLGGTVLLLLTSTVQTIGQLVACRLLQGALTGTVAASVALVASVTPPRRSGFTLGMMQTAVFLGVCLGPLGGGLVADRYGYRVAFQVGACIVFLGGLLVYFGTHEHFTPPDPARDEQRGTFAEIFRTSGFLAAVMILFSVRFSNSLSSPSFPLIVEEILPGTQNLNSITGSIVAAAALAGAISAAVLGLFGDAWGHARVLIVCSLVAAGASIAHLLADSVGHLLAARVLLGLGVAGMIPAANAVIRIITDDRNMGKAFGAATALSMSGFALGPFLGGWTASKFSLRTPFLITGLGQLAVAVIVILWIKPAHTAPSLDAGDADSPGAT